MSAALSIFPHPSPSILWISESAPDHPEFIALSLACQFYGFHLHSSPHLPNPSNPPPLLIVIHSHDLTLPALASTVATLSTPHPASPPLAIVGIHHSTPSSHLFPFSSPVSISPSPSPTSSALWVSASLPAQPGFPLRNLPIPLASSAFPATSLPHSPHPSVYSLASLGPSPHLLSPALLRIQLPSSTRYFLPQFLPPITSSSPLLVSSHFGSFLPFFLLLLDAAPTHCFLPPALFANLTIDDPSLSQPYGALDFPKLVAEMHRVPFHTTIAFIPWNHLDSNPHIVDLFLAHPDLLSIAVHGNNHDGEEFASDPHPSDPSSSHLAKIRQALSRMDDFSHETSLPYDRVMIFPHRLAPSSTLLWLKKNGFTATANFHNLPPDASPPPLPADTLRSVNSLCHDFPALSRSYPHEYPESAVALDLFLGNPILYMAHQDTFTHGIDSFTPHAHRLNSRAPHLRWASLGEISLHLYRLRWHNPRHCHLLLDSSLVQVSNPHPHPAHFHFAKTESSPEEVVRVTVDHLEHPWNLLGNSICFSLLLSPSATALIQIHYHLVQNSPPISIAKSGLRNHALRAFSDLRDRSLSDSPLGQTFLHLFSSFLHLFSSSPRRIPRRTALLYDPTSPTPLTSTLLPHLPASLLPPPPSPPTLLIPHDFEIHYTLGFAKALAANHLPFVVASSNEIATQLSDAHLPHIPIRHCPLPSASPFAKALHLIAYYFRLLWLVFRLRDSTLHFTGLLERRWILLDAFLLPPWFRLWSKRYIHTAHNLLPHDRAHHPLFKLAYAFAYRFPTDFVAHTQKIADDLHSQFHIPTSKIHVASIGINQEVPPSTLSQNDARLLLNLPTTSPIVLFFGKIEPYKGLDLLIQSWPSVQTPHARLLIVGRTTDPAYHRLLANLIAASPAAHSIEWRHSFIPDSDIAPYMIAADLLVLPYRHIYQSGVLFLALRFGLPIVATPVGSLPDFIPPSVGLITASIDPPAIASSINQFFSSPIPFHRPDIAAFATQFSWDRQAFRLKPLYQ